MTVSSAPALGPDVLWLDAAAEVARISEWMVSAVATTLHRRGVVIAISGGVDSSVCAALAVHAFGPKKVYGLLLPERDSSGSSAERGRLVAEQLGIAHELFDIAPPWKRSVVTRSATAPSAPCFQTMQTTGSARSPSQAAPGAGSTSFA